MTETVCTLSVPGLVFGPGASREAGWRAAALGSTRALLVTDAFLAERGLHEPVVAACAEAGVEVVAHLIPVGEPNESTLARAGAAAREAGVDGVIGLGGGSALDTAKTAALLGAHGGKVRDYVNAPLGRALAPPGPLLPLLAVPTTAGTGSEVTAVAVLDLPDERVKTGIAHPLLRPLVALCDPELTAGVPAAVTAATGIDALLHAAEAFTAIPHTHRAAPATPAARPNYQGAHPLADVWVRHAIGLVGRFLERAVADGSDREARAGMMLAATAAGIGFGHAGVHVPHACAYPIAGLKHGWKPPGYPGEGRFVPHGIACALTAPAAFGLTHPAQPERHREAACLLTGREPDTDDPNPLGEAVRALMQRIGLPARLEEVGYGADDVPALVAGAEMQQRLLACAPLPVDGTLLERVLRNSL
ncbi:MAG: hydroxyacid-oxoacid transhydrogenase [Gaiellales bacterium]